ncbi:hypothetical protein Tco_0242130 [Tanacetum coccineum]
MPKRSLSVGLQATFKKDAPVEEQEPGKWQCVAKAYCSGSQARARRHLKIIIRVGEDRGLYTKFSKWEFGFPSCPVFHPDQRVYSIFLTQKFEHETTRWLELPYITIAIFVITQGSKMYVADLLSRKNEKPPLRVRCFKSIALELGISKAPLASTDSSMATREHQE